MTTREPLKARKTVHLGVEMRSRLEGIWAQRFTKAGFEWDYEPICFSNEQGQYLPDFRLFDPRRPKKSTYVELKGVTDDPDGVMRRMEIIWASEPSATLILIEDRDDRYWVGWKDPDRGAVWFSHDGSELGDVT